MSYEGRNGKAGFLLIPGLTDQPALFRHLEEDLERLGYFCHRAEIGEYHPSDNPRAAGRWKSWLRQCRDAVLGMKKEFGTVYAAGHSAGGLLAVILGEEHLVDGVISLASPVLFRKDCFPSLKDRLHLPKTRIIGGDYREKERLCTLSPQRNRDLRRLGTMTGMNLDHLQCPILVAQGEEDPFAAWESMDVLLDGSRSVYKEKLQLEGMAGQHLENGSQVLEEKIADFLQKSEEMRQNAEKQIII